MTTKEIELLLLARGFRFVKSLGQNFLMDEEILKEIAAHAVLEGESVLEIGAGAGCLTKELAQRAGRVLTVEIDQNLLPVLDAVLMGKKNVTVIKGDALRLDLSGLCAEFLGSGFSVAANLPYGITTQMMQTLFLLKEARAITVMLQKEAVERILCAPGSKEYGPLSVLCRYLYEAKVLLNVPPHHFLPQPHVESTVLTLTRKEGIQSAEEGRLRAALKAAFVMRRKTLLNNLGAAFGREKALMAIERAGLLARVRAEDLDLEQFLRLSNFL